MIGRDRPVGVCDNRCSGTLGVFVLQDDSIFTEVIVCIVPPCAFVVGYTLPFHNDKETHASVTRTMRASLCWEIQNGWSVAIALCGPVKDLQLTVVDMCDAIPIIHGKVVDGGCCRKERSIPCALHKVYRLWEVWLVIG